MIDMDDILKIKRKNGLKGDDGHRTFSIRVPEETAAQLDALAKDSNYTRNELINMLLRFGLAHYEIVD